MIENPIEAAERLLRRRGIRTEESHALGSTELRRKATGLETLAGRALDKLEGGASLRSIVREAGLPERELLSRMQALAVRRRQEAERRSRGPHRR